MKFYELFNKIKLKLYRQKLNVVSIFCVNNSYVNHIITTIKYNKNYLKRCYFNNDKLKLNHRNLDSLYLNYKIQHLYAFCEVKQDAYDAVFGLNYTVNYYFFYEKYDKNVEKDLLKIVDIENINYGLKEAIVKIFNFKNFPEYYL